MEKGETSPSLLASHSRRVIDVRTWAAAAVVVLVLLGTAAIATLRRSAGNPGASREDDLYARNLTIGDVTLSEATNGTGGKATYVDGTVTNTGNRVLAGAVVQVTFQTAHGPVRESVPLAVVRSREPYVDLQSLSAAPLAPARQRDFRLIFDSVPADWDAKAPAIHVVHAELK